MCVSVIDVTDNSEKEMDDARVEILETPASQVKKEYTFIEFNSSVKDQVQIWNTVLVWKSTMLPCHVLK